MTTVLDYYSQYSPESNLEWDGIKCSKFGKTRKHFTPRDSIRSSTHYFILRSINPNIFYEYRKASFLIKSRSIKVI